MGIDPGNAAALIVALADLAAAKAGALDLTDCDRADAAAVYVALKPWLLVDPSGG
jgi:hypothetical protein